MIGRTTLGTMASVLLVSGATHAADSGFYAGITAGQADHDVQAVFEVAPGTGTLTYDSATDSKDTSIGAFGGYQFGRWFAVEGAFNHLGTSSLDYAFAYEEQSDVLEANGTGDFESHALSIAALAIIPLGESFTIGIRAGGAYSKIDIDAKSTFRFNGSADPTETSRRSDSAFAPVYGLHAAYAATANVSVRIDWQRFNDVGKGLESFDGYDIDLLALSALWRF